jgi:hypothetical protein
VAKGDELFDAARRLAVRGIEAGADYIPDAIETPLRRAFGVELPRAPRPRQKPVIRKDNPGGEWLKHERRRAEENVSKRSTPVSGAVTGYLKKTIELDPRKLEAVPGANNERRVSGESQYDRLRPLIEAEGFRQDSPILVGVNHRGEPYIIEGNTRAAVARDLGIDRIPAEVRYFAGGEGVEGPMMPELLENYMPPSELMLDPNFQRFFGNSKAVDKYGEPQRFFHGTKGNISAFDPSRIGQSDFGASGRGFYFSQDPGTAGLYAQLAKGEGDPNIIAAYLSAQNPLELGAMLPRDINESMLLSQRAREAGHDAIVVRNPRDNMIDEYVVFDPKQIKSAIGNRGTYDPEDPDITKARGGLAVKPVWDKKRPKDLGKPKDLSAKKKKSAKARAKAAGRPFPNLIDNMAAARKKGK